MFPPSAVFLPVRVLRPPRSRGEWLERRHVLAQGLPGLGPGVSCKRNDAVHVLCPLFAQTVDVGNALLEVPLGHLLFHIWATSPLPHHPFASYTCAQKHLKWAGLAADCNLENKTIFSYTFPQAFSSSPFILIAFSASWAHLVQRVAFLCGFFGRKFKNLHFVFRNK